MKPTRPTTPRPKRAASPTFRFPTATALRKMPLRQRSLALLRFLRSKPRRKTYVYLDNANCAMGQFAQGVYRSRNVLAGPFTIRPARSGDRITLVEAADTLNNGPRTFGAAADRLAIALGVE